MKLRYLDEGTISPMLLRSLVILMMVLQPAFSVPVIVADVASSRMSEVQIPPVAGCCGDNCCCAASGECLCALRAPTAPEPPPAAPSQALNEGVRLTLAPPPLIGEMALDRPGPMPAYSRYAAPLGLVLGGNAQIAFCVWRR